MATAQQIQAVATLVDGLETTEDLQEELDGANARLDAIREQVRIVKSVITEPSYTDEYKLQMVAQILGDQA